MADLVDTLCLLLVPGTGDELQGIKRGLMEVADVVVVNKADGDRVNAANRARGDFRQALHMLPPSTPGWETPVLTASALEGTGLAEIWDAVEGHRKVLEESGLLEERRGHQHEVWLDSMIEDAALEHFLSREGVTEAVQAAQAAVASGEKTVPEAFLSVLESAGN